MNYFRVFRTRPASHQDRICAMMKVQEAALDVR
jgi:hypothetical protein